MQNFFLLIFTIFLVSCLSKSEKRVRFTKSQIVALQLDSTKILKVETDASTKIDLNPFLKEQAFDFGSLVKELKLIPLETTNKSLLDDIYEVIVTDSNIYIQDDFKGGSIVIFDKEGEFVKRIPNGKGPGEVNRLYDIDFDKSKNELIAYQHSFLLFFTPCGQFKRRKRLPLITHKFSVIPEGYVFKSLAYQGNAHMGFANKYTFYVTDNNFKLKSVGLPCVSSGVNLEGRNYLYNNNNKLHVTQKFTDTIYHYECKTDQLKAKYILDYNKKKLPENYQQGTWDEFDNAVKKNDYYFNLGEYLNTEDCNVFFLNNWYKGFGTIVYRDKRSGNLRGGTTANYDLNEIPPIAFPKTVSNNYLISWYYPGENDLFTSNSSIISNEDKLKLKQLSSDDNPVLVFFKLKNF